MTKVAGIDPGASGAIAIYDTDTRRVIAMYDIPIWYASIGKRKKKRIDELALAELFEMLEMMNVELIVLEEVGGRPGQSASAGFSFGYGVGLICMAIVMKQMVVEKVPPRTWKSVMNVKGKAKATDEDIMAKAKEMFPKDVQLFRGVKGGKKIDRAEAAMLAKFGGDHVLNTLSKEATMDDSYFAVKEK